jgi:hypothetical protein
MYLVYLTPSRSQLRSHGQPPLWPVGTAYCELEPGAIGGGPAASWPEEAARLLLIEFGYSQRDG